MLFRNLHHIGSDRIFNANVGDGIPALSRFDARFTNGDHHLKRLIIGGKTSDGRGIHDENSFLLQLSDLDDGAWGEGSDTVDIRIGYVNFGDSPYLEGGGSFSVSGRGRRRHDVSVAVPEISSDEVIVLRGFQFSGLTSSNHHIRTVQVRYFTDPSEFIVRFRDDSPDDDEYAFTVHYLVLKTKKEERYNFWLDGIHTQRVEFVKEATVRKEVPGMALLSGFSFQFLDGDHHIRRIAVNVEDRDSIFVCFTDDERDNPVLGFVDFTVLRT